MDNQGFRKGDLLFTIDRVRLRNALAQAEAAVAVTRATLDAAERENRRYRQLGDIVSGQQRDERRSQAEEARARYTQALADRDLARINLERSAVCAPVNGIVTNFSLRPGAYATAGQQIGRSSGRDRVWPDVYISVDAVTLKKKKRHY